MNSLYEILIPVYYNDGDAIPSKVITEWTDFTIKLAGGLTRFPEVIGSWRSQNGKVYTEYMVPFRVACKKEDMEKLAELALRLFKQEAIMITEVSNNVIFRSKADYADTSKIREL